MVRIFCRGAQCAPVEIYGNLIRAAERRPYNNYALNRAR